MEATFVLHVLVIIYIYLLSIFFRFFVYICHRPLFLFICPSVRGGSVIISRVMGFRIIRVRVRDDYCYRTILLNLCN